MKSVQQLFAPKSFYKDLFKYTTTKLLTAITINQLTLPSKQHFTLGQEFLQGKFSRQIFKANLLTNMQLIKKYNFLKGVIIAQLQPCPSELV